MTINEESNSGATATVDKPWENFTVTAHMSLREQIQRIFAVHDAVEARYARMELAKAYPTAAITDAMLQDNPINLQVELTEALKQEHRVMAVLDDIAMRGMEVDIMLTLTSRSATIKRYNRSREVATV